VDRPVDGRRRDAAEVWAAPGEAGPLTGGIWSAPIGAEALGAGEISADGVVAVADAIAADEPASMSDLTQTDAAEVVTDDQDWAAVASLHKLKLRDDGAEVSTPLHPDYCWAKTLAPWCEYLEWSEHSCHASMDQICIYQRFSWLDSASLIECRRNGRGWSGCCRRCHRC
jgi:hypothetical protein